MQVTVGFGGWGGGGGHFSLTCPLPEVCSSFVNQYCQNKSWKSKCMFLNVASDVCCQRFLTSDVSESVCVCSQSCVCMCTYACLHYSVHLCLQQLLKQKHHQNRQNKKHKPSSGILLSSWSYFHFLLSLWWHSAQHDWLSFFPSGCQLCLRQLLRSGTAAEDLGQRTSPLHPRQVKHLWCHHHSCAGGTFDYWGFDHQTWRSVRQYWGRLCLHACQCSGSVYRYWGSVHQNWCAFNQYWLWHLQISIEALSITEDVPVSTEAVQQYWGHPLSGYACQCWGSVHQYWGCAWGCPSVLRLSTFRLCLSMLRFCLSVLRLSISIEAIHL